MTSNRHDRSFWKRLLAEVEGGDTIAEVARRHRVKPRTLSWWHWRIGATRKKVVASRPRFLPVIVEQSAATSGSEISTTIDIEVGDVRIHVPVSTDVGYVAALIASIRKC